MDKKECKKQTLQMFYATDGDILREIKMAMCTFLQKNRQRVGLAGYAKRELEIITFLLMNYLKM